MNNTNKDAGDKKTQKTVTVKLSRCPQNHPCPAVRVCPVDALKQKGYSAPIVDSEKCIMCRKCVSYCPMGALVTE